MIAALGAETALTERLDVILNDRVLLLPLTGVGHYVRQLLEALRGQADAEVHPFMTGVLRLRARDPDGAPQAAKPAGALASGAAPHGGGAAPSLRTARPGLLSRVRRSVPMRALLQNTYAAAFRIGARGHQLYHEPNHVPIRLPPADGDHHS